MELDRNMHSVFLLNYHLVLVTKYRKKVFDDAISARAKEIFVYIGENYHIKLVEWNHDVDHVHILFRAHPNTQISRFINAYKSASSRLLKKEYPQIRYYEQLKYLLILYCAFRNTLLLAWYNSLLFPLFCFIITYFLHKEKSTPSVFRKCRLFILVEIRGFEPLTYALRTHRSTN